MLSHTTQLLYPLCHTFSHTPTHSLLLLFDKKDNKKAINSPSLYLFATICRVTNARFVPSSNAIMLINTALINLIYAHPHFILTHTHTCHTVPLYHPSVHSPIEVAGTRAMQLRWALCERGCRLLLHCASKDLSGRLRDRTVR